MSRSNRSWPTPTVKTGIERAFRLASVSSMRGVGGVGAVGHHHQPGERQPGELVARAIERRPEARRGAAVLQVAGGASAVRRGREAEEPQRRIVCDSAVEQRRVRPCRAAPGRTSLRGWPSRSAIVMLRESSIRTPRKFCCGTAALRISVGRNRQKSSTATAREPQRRPAPPGRAAGPRW